MSMTAIESVSGGLRRVAPMALIALLVLSLATMPVAAADSDGDGVSDSNDECPNTSGVSDNSGCPESGSGAAKDFLCTSEGNVASGAEGLVGMLRNVVGAFMVIGPVGGIVVALYATVASSATPSDDGSENYQKMRRNSLIGGFSVPIGAYALETLSSALLGFNISCIVP